MVKIVASIANWFTGLDKFGHPINVFFQGGSIYKTKLGAFLSIAVNVLVLGCIIVKLLELVNMSDPSITIMRKNLTKRQIDEYLPFNLDDFAFNMGIVVVDSN